MSLLLVLLLACETPVRTPEVPSEPAAEVGPADHLAALQAGLDLARERLDAGDRAGAAAQVRATYQQDFGPLEPLLRDHDAQACLELEYGFGLLAARVEDRRSGVDLKAEAAALVGRVKTAVDAAEAAAAAAAQVAPK